MGIEERNKLRDAFTEEKRQYKIFQDEQRRIRNEKMAEERKKEQEARRLKQLEREVEALDDQPFVDELTRIDQCTRFCKSLLPKETGSKQEETKQTVHNNKANEVVMLSKEDRAAEEFFFAPTKVKSKKGKKSGGAGDDKKKDQKITLNMDNFGDWAFLKIEPPMFVSDLEATLVKRKRRRCTLR